MQAIFRRTVCAVSLSLAAFASAAFGDFTIDRIVPENAVLVMGMSNAEQSLERFRRTPMHELLQSPELREFRREFTKDFTEGWQEMLGEIGAPDDTTAWPTGSLGMALYPVMDPELGTPKVAMIAFAQFGEQIDGVMEIVRKAIAKGVDAGELVTDELDVLGRTAHVLDFGAAEDEDEFEDDPFAAMMGMPDFSKLFDGFKRMYVVREGNALMLGSDLGSLTESLDRVDRGEGGLGNRSEYQRILAQLGTNDGFAMLLTRDALQLLSGADQQGMLMMAGPMLTGVFGDIQGFAASVRLDSPQAMMEQSYVVYMPNGKGGLARLFNVPQPREQLPRFVGPNSVSSMSINIAFDQLNTIIRDIIRSNPMLNMFLAEEYREVEPMIRELTGSLGSRMYVASTLTRPITPESSATMFAIECRDERAFENFISQFAPGMGFQPRDFLGQRIYTMDEEMNMLGMMLGIDAPSMSIGIGGGFAFIGQTTGVEMALRTVSQQDQLPSLADEPAFRRAAANLPDRPLVMWWYSDIASTLEAGMIAAEDEDFPGLGDMKLDWDLLRRYIGPAVSFVESTDAGFVGRSYYLRAQDD
jgi:hypothetical protein